MKNTSSVLATLSQITSNNNSIDKKTRLYIGGLIASKLTPLTTLSELKIRKNYNISTSRLSRIERNALFKIAIHLIATADTDCIDDL